MTTYTQNLSIPKPAFSQDPWHIDMWEALDKIDEIVTNALSSLNVVTWSTPAAFGVGTVAIDSSDGSIYVCKVEHDNTGLGYANMAAERVANPIYWASLLSGINPRGAWQFNTAYKIYDTVFSTTQGILALCTTAHTSRSSGTIRDDAANWAFVIDYTTIGTAAATSFTPTGNVAATNVQDAVAELDTEKPSAGVGLAASKDFNTVTTAGFYYTTDAAGTNTPSSLNGSDNWFFLAVEVAGTAIKQIAFGINTGKLFSRFKVSGTWSTWIRYYSINDITTASHIRSNTGTDLITIDQAWSSVEWIDLGNITGAVTLDASTGLKFFGTMVGNITVSVTNLKHGQQIEFAFKQDSTGSRTITWSSMSHPNGTTPAIVSTASTWALMGTVSDMANGAFKLCVGFHI